MDVVIIEDEDLAANYLKKNLLNQDIVTIDKVTVLESVKEALCYFSDTMPDLVFMDIHLEDGNSMEILESVRIPAPIIFTTAYDAYAIRAFKHFTVDYLLKPFDADDLNRALKKFREITQTYGQQYQLDALQRFFKEGETRYQKRFLVNHGHQLRSIEVGDISFFYASGKHLFIYTGDGNSFLYNSTIRDVITRLNPADFFKINRNYVISMASVARIVKHDNLRLEVVLNQPVPGEERIFISKTETRYFKEWLDA
ncbi:LytR/AlgR family response regulator transcription factor [Sinomicrobium weinanense]|uniref:Response regulator transcription factor n=1 Tax=Sinomicrobium weinanense TaxID=2842200 RepID=A0A926JPB8_9FLAO|nr:LytTR family DNA-binding domain-containing protein [Sinomicrobium weinanense]MBC9795000.1 response regulator transcription factor [Sinomicrobium weinanense]MBU3125139.1 LytTR family DNA-binding domain-containing protein [Sinomicrobium weinanense]